MGKLYLFLIFFVTVATTTFAQCGDTETFTVCDMTVVDGDSNGTPDGIINLYEEFSTLSGTTITAADGMWFDPNFNFALDVVTGDLYLWDLDSSSELDTDYQFEFLSGTSGCPEDVQYLFNIVLGPYSGTVANTMDGAINLQICQPAPPAECMQFTEIDLFQTMLSNPSPHSNGEWTYTGSSANFVSITGNRFLNVNIPYQEGPPLVDEETFELVYTVPGITPCDAEQSTTVTVSVVREPFAGFANQFNICDTELIAGNYDGDIDLLEDEFLVNENIEGIWLDATDPTGQISGPGDSVINLAQVYADLAMSNPRFGSQTYEYQYFVESRSTVCNDATSTIGFTFYESVRPFSQNENEAAFCTTDETLGSVNLYDYVEFTTENGVLYDYPNNDYTNWTLISGPSDLGLVSNTGDIATTTEDPGYTSQGTIDLSNLDPLTAAGTYVFEFTVDEAYNAEAIEEEIFEIPDGCSSEVNEDHPCDTQTTQITIIITNPNYAGEDTADLEFCENEETLTLTDLLETDGVQTVYVGPDGVWTDTATSTVVDNNFFIPEITGGSQTFDFVYNTTTSASDCADSATLSFTIYEQYDAGEDTLVDICANSEEVDLFTLLEGSPDTNGTWTGPEGYTTTDNVANYDPATNAAGDYVYTVPSNESCDEDMATLSITLLEFLYAGEDTAGVELCDVDAESPIDLINLLDTNGTDTIYEGTQGVWTDTVSGDEVANPFLYADIDGQATFNFTYTTTSDEGCIDSATLEFTLFESVSPGVDAIYETCAVDDVVNLFDFLEGTPATTGTWTGPEGYITTDNEAIFDPTINAEGNYVYTAPANGVCEALSATITVSFFENNYPGEDTAGVTICDEAGFVSLISLLETNGVEVIYSGPLGEFTDAVTGEVVDNFFFFPEIDGEQDFSFIYATTTENGCDAQATLDFTVFEQGDPGITSSIVLCQDDAPLDLFLSLSGTPDTTGTWTGPGGYVSSSSEALLDPMTALDGDYIYTIAATDVCPEAFAWVNVTVNGIANAGEDLDTFVCPGDYTLSLFDFLSEGADVTGQFIDLDTSLTIDNGLLSIGDFEPETFSYMYLVENDNCGDDDATITFTITAIEAPSVADPETFCVNDDQTLGDILVTGAAVYNWYAFAEAGSPLPLSTLLENNVTYYVAAIDENGCESERVSYLADILPLTDGSCQQEISDGVSDNGDGQNDFLDLGTYPDLYPNFDIQIFNRYGTIVYRGNKNTPAFDGSANTGSALGDQLPTGVYFYILYPNDSETEPIDGNFYLSR